MPTRVLTTVLFLITLLTATLASAATETVLYSFQGGSDGAVPQGVVMDKSGNLYGTTERGGKGGNINCFGNGCGFIYELSPASGGGWTKTDLYSFTGKKDGGVPVGNLAIDAKGNLYGVTEQGGTGDCSSVLGAGCGVVFRLSPNSKGGWDYAVIHDFDQNIASDDGSYPNAGVVFDQSGNLYGTTTFGGSFVCDCGVVYQLAPAQNGQWTENVLYLFEGISQGGTDVSFPDSDVFVDSAGRVFGTGTGGGDVNCNDGCGGVFELLPQSDGTYTEQVLHIFTGGTDGFDPEGGVLEDSKGNIFGTTELGGGSTGCRSSFGCGTVFELQPSGGSYQESVIFVFNGKNGYEPTADLIIDGQGNLYGTAQNGGTTGNGVAFELSNTSGQWQPKRFNFSGADGSGPDAVLSNEGRARVFSTTAFGGTAGQGTVFEIVR
jgi:uncharacterized repeat protein (TIGR03803 family)